MANQETDERRIAGRMMVRDDAGQARVGEDDAPVRWGTREHMEQVITEGGSVLHEGEIISSHRALPAREAIAAKLREREAADVRGVASRVKELTAKVDDQGDEIDALKKRLADLEKPREHPKKD